MGEFGNLVARIAVAAVSPDGGVRAEVRGGDRVEMRFSPEAYRSYREPVLAHQLDQLGALLWVRYRRTYLDTLDRYVGGLMDDGYHTVADRDFWDRMEQLTVTGISPHREISVGSRALVNWKFEITPGTLRGLREEEFVSELQGAVNVLLANYRAQVVLLTDEVYGLGLPPTRRTEGGS